MTLTGKRISRQVLEFGDRTQTAIPTSTSPLVGLSTLVLLSDGSHRHKRCYTLNVDFRYPLGTLSELNSVVTKNEVLRVTDAGTPHRNGDRGLTRWKTRNLS